MFKEHAENEINLHIYHTSKKKKKNTDMYVFIVKWKLRETLENLMAFFNL